MAEILLQNGFITAAWIKNDETPWCSATINHGAKEVGLEHTNKPNARSWLYVGQEISEPVRGNDIAIFHRKGILSPYGHVGAWIREDSIWVWVLSGNQNNQLNISPYPRSKVLGYRRLRSVHCAA